ncbi:MAG: hypothetical protein ACPLQO_09300 [Desulfotomaculales bacterium]
MLERKINLEIIYSKHFLNRKKLREISNGLAETILNHADEHYKDTQTGYFVAVKSANFQGKTRELALTYEKSENKITIITLHPLKKGQKENRIKTRRWVKQ